MIEGRVNIKPLSLNSAYRGRRFKTPEHVAHAFAVTSALPKFLEIPKPPYKISFVFGLSNKGADADNNIKVQQDLIANKYKFNDNLIYKWEVEKKIVEKGKEYFWFKLEHFDIKT